jgi:hypothetical protein
MRMPFVRRLALALAGLSLCASTPARSEAAAVPIAVVDFDYSDSSGEARDQTGEHAARLDAFMQSLRRDLEASGKYRVVALTCPGEPCSAARSDARDLIDAAKRAGARLLLYGRVHKMSTLVQWAKAQMVDVTEDRLVDDRWLSFRGDSDDAWRRAERFLVEQLKSKSRLD